MTVKAGLIDDLKNEHNLLLTALDKVNKLGIGSPEGQNELQTTKSLLLNHIRKEDSYLYPVLNEKAKTNPYLARTLELFAKDMNSISEYCLQFFERYSKGGSGIEFAKDYGRLFTMLKSRASKEEQVIFSQYE